MLQWIEAHGFECIAAYYLFSSLIGGMPSPDDKSSTGYKWLFTSAHILAGNLARIPQIRALVGQSDKQ